MSRFGESSFIDEDDAFGSCFWTLGQRGFFVGEFSCASHD